MATPLSIPLHVLTSHLMADRATGATTATIAATIPACVLAAIEGWDSPSMPPLMLKLIRADALDADGCVADPAGAATFACSTCAVCDFDGLVLIEGADQDFAIGDTAEVYMVSRTADQLCSRAPVASPTFTGAPTVPTPDGADDSTRAASTAWVRAHVAAAASVMGSRSDGTALANLLAALDALGIISDGTGA